MTFRGKLMTIVGTAALALLIMIVTSTLISNRVEARLIDIQQRYLPKLELGPRLEAQLDKMRRAFQDAVAAHDVDALAGARELKNGFLEQLALAKVVDPTDGAALRNAIEDYHSTAGDVSRRLIAGETGEPIVQAMAAMQTRQARAADLLEKATAFDRAELIEAFSAATRALVIGLRVRLVISAVCLAFVLALSFAISRGVLRSLADLTTGLRRFGTGDFGRPVEVRSRDELGAVAQHANQMAHSLRQLGEERDRADWLKTGLGKLAQELRGELEPEEAANRAVRVLAAYLDAPAAALYVTDEDGVLRLLGQYALAQPNAAGIALPSFRLGDGLIGQAALQTDIKVVVDPPADYLRIRSGLGEGAPRVIVLVPLLHAGKVTGVLELALFRPWTETASALLLSVRETLAIALEVARARTAARALLAETQRQAQRLAMQEEELRSTNEELQTQQEELRQSNEELAQQAEELEVQRRTLESNNAELDESRRRLERKAEEVATVSAYKSQFLANMSHELRTPLNSMLLLSNLLSENESGNLTAKQVEFSTTIHSAGKDLLALINQVLDLAKVEAGKQDLRISPVPLAQLVDHVRRVFEPLARHKGLGFVAEVAAGLPETIATDNQRIQQVLNNLLANAIKFTDRGEVTFRIAKPGPGVRFRRDDLRADQMVAFVVSDTGPGIAPEHQERIFAPFEQVESAADRRFGGTGLGLTIAREFAILLGGELQLRSAPGEGSSFICYLPFQGPAVAADSVPPPPRPVLSSLPARAGGTLLIIEDDATFAQTFGEIIQSQGLNFVVAPNGRTGLELARESKPTGIILDVKLPDTDGWSVMERLRSDPATAGIPVHFVSAVDAAERGLGMGAVGYLTKPATRRDLIQVIESLASRRSKTGCTILIVEDDLVIGDSLLKQLAIEDLEARRVTNAKDALEAVGKERFDCIILDLSLPDMNGLELLRSFEATCGSEMPSVVVYTARALSKDEAKRLEAYAEAVVLKEGSSTERLLDEVRLFTRRLNEGVRPRRKVASEAQLANVRLEGRRILVVDDDMRTMYALSATLRARGAEVLVADTGRAALSVLFDQPNIEAVLMDIMMPEMDGYEAMKRIRQDGRFRALPIIALTAKAMKGDRERCLEAGATDYLPKPIDPDRLLAMLHARLYGTQSNGS